MAKKETAKGEGYIIRDLEAIESEELSFGKLHVLTDHEDFEKANVVLVVMNKPDTPHYHNETTEFYFVVEGIGRMKLDGKERSIRKGHLILIKPGTVHCAAPVGSPADLKILRVLIPAYDPRDELPVPEDPVRYGFKKG